MTVKIDELEVDVQKSAEPARSTPEGAAEPKEATNFRAEREMLSERELRLKAD